MSNGFVRFSASVTSDDGMVTTHIECDNLTVEDALKQLKLIRDNLNIEITEAEEYHGS